MEITGLNQVFFERPDRSQIWNLATGTQSGKALEAQPVQQLKLHLFIGEIEQLLNQQHPHHQFDRE